MTQYANNSNLLGHILLDHNYQYLTCYGIYSLNIGGTKNREKPGIPGFSPEIREFPGSLNPGNLQTL